LSVGAIAKAAAKRIADHQSAREYRRSNRGAETNGQVAACVVAKTIEKKSG